MCAQTYAKAHACTYVQLRHTNSAPVCTHMYRDMQVHRYTCTQTLICTDTYVQRHTRVQMRRHTTHTPLLHTGHTRGKSTAQHRPGAAEDTSSPLPSQAGLRGCDSWGGQSVPCHCPWVPTSEFPHSWSGTPDGPPKGPGRVTV